MPLQEAQDHQVKETQEVLQVVELVLEQVAAVAQADQELKALAAALAVQAHLGQAMVVLMQVAVAVAVDHVPVMEVTVARVAGHRAAVLTLENLLLRRQAIRAAVAVELPTNQAPEPQEVAGRVSSS